MMKIEVMLSAVFLLVICKSSFAQSESHPSPSPSQYHGHAVIPAEIHSQEKRSVNPRDLMRYLLLSFHPNSAHYGRGSMGIPFRPVRRIGSEFLGKRSVGMPPTSEEMEDYLSSDKRVMGSEFLGKRRLGSEFLGKRSGGGDDDEYDGTDGGNLVEWLHHQRSQQAIPFQPEDAMMMDNFEKRRLGSEFLGKRRNGISDWSWKRGRLGSEFLGKRKMGSEFLGKRDVSDSGQQEQLGPRDMTQTLENIEHMST